jgi:hypothetical protein
VVTSAPAVIQIDGVDVSSTPTDKPIAVAAGTRLVAALSSGYLPSRKEITIAGGITSELTFELIVGAPGAPSPANLVPPPGTPSPTGPPPILSSSPTAGSEGHGSGSRLRTVGLVTGSVGIVGLGVGAFLGLRAIGQKNDANCSADKVCPTDAAAKSFRDATSTANLSTVFFVTGAVLAGTGVALHLIAPRKSVSSAVRLEAAPNVATGAAGMTVLGSF